jgi:dihydroxyacetone kinase-like predicted kinase
MNNVVVSVDHPNVSVIKTAILDRISMIAKKKEEIKANREMLTDVLENNKKYREAKEVESGNHKERMVIEEKIKLANPEIINKTKELREELNDLTEALNDYIAEFVRMTGKMEIRKNDGTEIKFLRKYKICPGQQKLL